MRSSRECHLIDGYNLLMGFVGALVANSEATEQNEARLIILADILNKLNEFSEIHIEPMSVSVGRSIRLRINFVTCPHRQDLPIWNT